MTTEPSTDSAGHIETRGIDHIPDSERHGRARDLFAVWAAPNVSYLTLVLGGSLMPLFGLSLTQSLVVAVVGNLFWVAIGITAASGNASGTPSEVVMRAMFGVRGNRVNIAVTGWLLCVCYIALNLAAAALAAFALAGELGWNPDRAGQIALVVAIAAVTLTISVYGHATITRLYAPLAITLAVAFGGLGAYVIGHAHWHYAPDAAAAPHGTALVAAFAGGITLIASGPLSYTNSADFARYLPRETPMRAVAGWTFWGAFLPSIALSAIGVLAGTAVDMTDPQDSLRALLPGWFYPVFLLAIVVGLVANNAMTAYSSGLALQAVGVKLRRSRSVLFDGAVGVAVTLYALFVSNFLDTVSELLQLSVVVVGPSVAIYVADVLIRRNRYDGPELADESPGSAFWFTGGVSWPGITALLAGMAAAAVCANTTVYTGPVASLLGGVDISLPAGMLISGALYAAFRRAPARPDTLYRGQAIAARPL